MNNNFIDEQNILNKISDVVIDFKKMEKQHPSEDEIFCDAIHKIQALIAVRIARSVLPEQYVTYQNNEKGWDKL